MYVYSKQEQEERVVLSPVNSLEVKVGIKQKLKTRVFFIFLFLFSTRPLGWKYNQLLYFAFLMTRNYA